MDAAVHHTRHLTRYADHPLFCSFPRQVFRYFSRSPTKAAARITRHTARNKHYRYGERDRFIRPVGIREITIDFRGNSSAKRCPVQISFFGILNGISRS
jgi:hypothetical protein